MPKGLLVEDHVKESISVLCKGSGEGEEFGININIYSMLEDGSVVKVYVSCQKHGSDTIYLNQSAFILNFTF